MSHRINADRSRDSKKSSHSFHPLSKVDVQIESWSRFPTGCRWWWWSTGTHHLCWCCCCCCCCCCCWLLNREKGLQDADDAVIVGSKESHKISEQQQETSPQDSVLAHNVSTNRVHDDPGSITTGSGSERRRRLIKCQQRFNLCLMCK